MASAPDTADSVVVHEEQLVTAVYASELGSVRVRKLVETYTATETVVVEAEKYEVERVPADPGDSGGVVTLDDGAISVPVYAEELVVSKELILRERVVLQKLQDVQRSVVETERRVERGVVEEQ